MYQWNLTQHVLIHQSDRKYDTHSQSFYEVLSTTGYVRQRRLTWNVVSSDVLSSLATVMLPVASLIVKYLGTGGSIMYRIED